MVGVSKDERAYVHALLLPAQHRVPHRRGVVGALDPVPRARRRVDPVGDPGLDELAVSRDLARSTCR